MPELKTEKPAPPTLHELRCQQVTDTYLAIDSALSARGRMVPPETVAALCGIALRLIMVRP
jgi:hypothetical protein